MMVDDKVYTYHNVLVGCDLKFLNSYYLTANAILHYSTISISFVVITVYLFLYIILLIYFIFIFY